MFREIHFANPKAAYYLVLGLFFVALFLYSLGIRKKVLIGFAEVSSLKKLLFLEKRTSIRYLLLSFVWFLSVLALMQPEKIETYKLTSEAQKETLDESLVDHNNEEKVIMKRQACEIIFLIDASASMETRDTRMKVSRLNFAKEIVDETLSQLDGQNVALYAFTSEVTPLVPSTMDYLFTRLLTKNIKINEGDAAGTDLLEALEFIGKKHFSKAQEKQTALVLLTDGGDTYLESLPDEERKNQIALILDKVKRYQDQKIHVFTVGLGTQKGEIIPNIQFEGKKRISSLDTELLTELSREGHGRYYFANDFSAPQIAESLLTAIRKESTYLEEEVIPQKKIKRSLLEKNPQNQKIIHYFQFPLGLAALLLGLELLMPCLPIKKKVLQDE